jgi:hypothetical protein
LLAMQLGKSTIERHFTNKYFPRRQLNNFKTSWT